MAVLMTRVELHDEQRGDYDKLHQEMDARDFSRTVKVDDIEYHLPDATYLLVSDISAHEACERAHEAARAIGREAGVFVASSDFDLMSAKGLKPIIV
jgi:cytidylate kinase